MYLIEVIPIARGIAKETLSYFSHNSIPEGSLVTVPIRKRVISALVISSKNAQEEKTAIKSSGFSIKKVDEFKSENFLSNKFMKAAKLTADFSAGSLGSTLSLLVPKVVLENFSEIKAELFEKESTNSHERLAIQAEDEERLATYRSLIREEFARKKSVFFCVPTAEEVKQLSELLPKGIENYTYALYGSLPKKKLLETWKNASQESHPVLIIATAPFFALNRNDLGTVVIENESSRLYKLPVRPFLDVRVFAEFFAKENDVRLVYGDVFLRTETIYRVKSGEIAEFSPLKFRSLTSAKSIIVDMTKIKRGSNGKFEILSPELESVISETHAKNQNLFVFAPRRGFSPQTVCGDCGTIVLCSRCKSPITLHHSKNEKGVNNFFFCHTCGEQRKTEERCAKCNSWKLQPLGIGIELVEEEIKNKFPKIKIFHVNKDATSTKKSVSKEVQSFYASPGSILLGTEMVLPYLNKKIENSAVATLDSLFSLPDFRIHEKILHILLKIRSITQSTFVVQTRNPEEKILDYALKGNLIDFYREEIAARQSFDYPPFATLIKVTLSGNKVAVTNEMEKLPEFFKPFETVTFPAFNETSKGLYTTHALIRLPKNGWINRELLGKLLSLPPQFKIAVEPESLL